ncbi:MAG: hypothetical protein ACMUIE_08915 [Thermoplasmatota archaeon]
MNGDEKWTGFGFFGWTFFWVLLLLFAGTGLFLIIVSFYSLGSDTVSFIIQLSSGSVLFVGTIWFYLWVFDIRELLYSIDRSWRIFELFPCYNMEVMKRFFEDFERRFTLVLFPGKRTELEKVNLWITRRYHLPDDEKSIVEVSILGGESLTIMVMGDAKQMTGDINLFMERESDAIYEEADKYLEFGGMVLGDNPRLKKRTA